MEGGQISAAGVSPQLEDGIEEDHDGERDQELVEQNCADGLAQFHGVHLPRKGGGRMDDSVRSGAFPSRNSTVTCSQAALIQKWVLGVVCSQSWQLLTAAQPWSGNIW